MQLFLRHVLDRSEKFPGRSRNGWLDRNDLPNAETATAEAFFRPAKYFLEYAKYHICNCCNIYVNYYGMHISCYVTCSQNDYRCTENTRKHKSLLMNCNRSILYLRK